MFLDFHYFLKSIFPMQNFEECLKEGQVLLEANDVPKEILTQYNFLRLWVEKLSQTGTDTAGQKLAIAVSKLLRPLAVKSGANSVNLMAKPQSNTPFAEVLRWEVTDELKYRMYIVKKMKSDELTGAAAEKVLGSLLGGVKLPTVSYAAEIKYNPRYLTAYDILLKNLNKIIVGNNIGAAEENRDKISETEEIIDDLEKNLKGLGDQSTVQPGIGQKAQNAIGYTGALAKTSKPVGKTSTSVSGMNITNPKDIPEAEVVESLNILDSVLMEASRGDIRNIADRAITDIGSGVRALPGIRQLANTIGNLKGLPGQFGKFIVPYIYDLTGYDFGYTGTTRITTPKVFKNKKVRSVTDILQFIENSHLYEDLSGRKTLSSKGEKKDFHQVKPTKMVIYRLPESNIFGSMKEDELFTKYTSDSLTGADIKKLEGERLTDVLKKLPKGTLVIAFWGRIINQSEIDSVSDGEKYIPKNIVLTAKERPEWYIFVPKVTPPTTKKIPALSGDVSGYETKRFTEPTSDLKNAQEAEFSEQKNEVQKI